MIRLPDISILFMREALYVILVELDKLLLLDYMRVGSFTVFHAKGCTSFKETRKSKLA